MSHLIKHAQLQGSVKFPAKISTGSPISILGRNPLASLPMSANVSRMKTYEFSMLLIHYFNLLKTCFGKQIRLE